MTLDAVLPSSAEVVTAFERVLRGGPRTTQGRIMGLLFDLLESNLGQWQLEDVSRDREATDASVATAKRQIDALNLGRHRLVQEIDAAVAAVLTPPPPSAPLATESPGMVFDRLSVLVIRLQRTELAATPGSPDSATFAARLAGLREHLAALCRALDALMEELQEGRRGFVLYEHLKLYGASSPAPPAEESDSPVEAHRR